MQPRLLGEKDAARPPLPEWAARMEPVGMAQAARLLGISKRTLTKVLKQHPHYELRGTKKVFYPEHVQKLRRVKWDSKSSWTPKRASSRSAAPSGATELERAQRRETERQRRQQRAQQSANTGNVVPLETQRS